MHFATPEASWKLAGGEASHASGNHRIIARKDRHPGRGAGLIGNEGTARSDPFPAPPAGAHSFLTQDPVVLALFGRFTTG
jgi:hypothetical protein